MPPFVPVPNTAEVVIEQSLAGQNVFNVLHFEGPGPFGIPDLNILATEVINAWIEFLDVIYSNQLSLVAVRATSLESISAPGVLSTVSPGTNGAIAVPPTPNNVALVLTLTTDLRGRSFRGRTYAAGMPQDTLVDPSHVTTTYQSLFLDQWTGFFTDVEDDAGVIHVITSLVTAGAPRVTGVNTEVTGYAVNQELDSQRRRLAGRGS